MYQPLIKFHPYPAIITQVLAIFEVCSVEITCWCQDNAGFYEYADLAFLTR